MTWSEVSRGVPRSPNRHLDQFRVLRQFEIGGLEVQFNGFSDVCARFLLGFACGRATGEFGAHRRVVAGLGIVFQNDSERHSNSIGQRDAAIDVVHYRGAGTEPNQLSNILYTITLTIPRKKSPRDSLSHKFRDLKMPRPRS